ncbi:MAG: hypothetical protein OER88_00690 [Planctomycetota bacterium]|nr:hypothetical protein [Planctomycetota bacterium]
MKEPLQRVELQSLYKLNSTLTVLGLAVKALFFLGFFYWASQSEVGDAGLRGVIAADALTFVIFGVIEWKFRRLVVTAGFLFEIALFFVYFGRHSLFDIPRHDVTLIGYAFVFGFPYLLVKVAVWGVEHVLETHGIRDEMPSP